MVNVVDLMTLPRPQGPPARHGRRRCSASCSPTTSTSSSPSTATPARSTSSSTAGPTPTASTCAASSRRARRRRRSTWWCATRRRRYHLVMDAINNAGRHAAAAPASSRPGARQQLGRARGLRRRAPRGHARGPRLGHDDGRRGLSPRDAGVCRRARLMAYARSAWACVDRATRQSRRGAMTTSMPLSRKACSATGSADSSVTRVQWCGMTAQAWKGDWPSLSACART